MPVSNGTPNTIANLSFSMIDMSANISKVSLPGLASAPTTGQVDALRTAIGNASNARLDKQALTADTLFPPGTALPKDEGHNSVAAKLVLVFFNAATRDVKKFELPAPDASLFLADGETVDVANAQVIALINAIQAIITTAYGLQRGFLSQRTRKETTKRLVPGSNEPALLELPPPEPGLDEE